MKKFDVICIGRIAVDLYAQQVGSCLEKVSSFAKYLGGSSGNIAYGSARQGLKVSMLARVGDDHFGRFIKNELEQVGVDTSHIIFDSKRLTGLAILGIKDRDTFPLLFYRHHCADMALTADDFSEEYIASSKSLLFTGTHFSTPEIAATSFKAITYAKKNDVKVVLDIDYRPTLWGLAANDDGETRYVESAHVSDHLQTIFPHCDLIVGTEEEFQIGGGNTDITTALKTVRNTSVATLVLKRGAQGNSVFEKAIPDNINDSQAIPLYRGVRVEVLNVLGAGDAFMSGFLRGWVNGEDFEQCSKYANACGALVVSRHACAPAIPTKEELDYYLKHAEKISHPDQDPQLNHLHHVTTRTSHWEKLYILAFDHRIQLEEIFTAEHGLANSTADERSKHITRIKSLILDCVEELEVAEKLTGKTGILLDGRYGQDLLNRISESGLWISRPVEKPKTHPVRFEPTPAIGNEILTWPKHHIIKCLFRYQLNEAEWIVQSQEEKMLELYDVSRHTGNELLLEIIPTDEDSSVLPVLLERIYSLGIKPDWWKLFPTTATQWEGITAVIKKHDPYCHGVLLLGLDSTINALGQQFALAKKYPVCKGFAVGRSIFYRPTLALLQGKVTEAEFKNQVKNNYLNLIKLWG